MSSTTAAEETTSLQTQTEQLFQPFQLGPYKLRHRMVMAPLTRSRSRQPGNIPSPMNACYYYQRASAALIISEATQISQQGQGYAWTPGIHTLDQVEGWRLVTEAVHKARGLIFMQLWHVGRISHPSLQPDEMLPVAPSAIKPKGEAFIENDRGEGELVPFVTPRALETEEIPYIVRQYVRGARNALEAGFDGVEVHAANGYLLDQFLNSETNRRADQYGGSIENRSRLLLEVVDQVIEIWRAERVGVRISPLGGLNDIATHKALFSEIITNRAKGLTEEQSRHRAFAAGLIIGNQQAQTQKLLDLARKAHSRFDGAKAFWKLPSRSIMAAPALEKTL